MLVLRRVPIPLHEIPIAEKRIACHEEAAKRILLKFDPANCFLGTGALAEVPLLYGDPECSRRCFRLLQTLIVLRIEKPEKFARDKSQDIAALIESIEGRYRICFAFDAKYEASRRGDVWQELTFEPPWEMVPLGLR
jgi:hypothetical protein